MENLPNKRNDGSLVNKEQFSKDIMNQKAESKMLLTKKLNLFDRFLPSVEQKAAKKYMRELLEQESKSEIEKHRMANEFFTQALQATYDDVLTKGVVKIQEDQTEDFVKRKAVLSKTISELSHNFIMDMEAEYLRSNQIKSEKLRKDKEEMLDDRIEEFKLTVKHLMGKFDEATKKSVGKKD